MLFICSFLKELINSGRVSLFFTLLKFWVRKMVFHFICCFQFVVVLKFLHILLDVYIFNHEVPLAMGEDHGTRHGRQKVRPAPFHRGRRHSIETNTQNHRVGPMREIHGRSYWTLRCVLRPNRACTSGENPVQWWCSGIGIRSDDHQFELCSDICCGAASCVRCGT